MIKRKKTKKIYVGDVAVGGDAPVTVQSMTNTDTRDVKRTVSQIRRLVKAGCDLVRVAVPDDEAAEALAKIIPSVQVPVIADIHFNYRLALKSIENGVNGIRINPGNIGNRARIAQVVRKAGDNGVAIRIGVNSGSLERDILKKFKHPCAEALVESALRNIEIVEGFSFNRIKVSIKSTDVATSVAAHRLLSKKTDYPLHIGITEAGTAFSGTIKSSVGLGILLFEGIGDTLRVSLSADPVKEVRAGFEILKCLDIRRIGPELISCPTCGRRQIDIITLANSFEKQIARFSAPLKIAVMGCEVNGPGEAKEADIGIAGSKKYGVIFKKGEIIKKCDKDQLLDELLKQVAQLQKQHDAGK